MKRLRYEVVPVGRWRGWRVMRGKELLGTFPFKKWAVIYAAEFARMALILSGEKSELIIKGKDGRIMDSRTYGDDPPKTKG